jgi:uncharacterized protein (TIGR02246 family)
MSTALDELLARDEIRQLMARYNTAGDTGRREEFASVFTEDAQLVAPNLDLRTREAIVAGLFQAPDAASAKRPAFRVYRHHLTTCKIDVTGPDAAKGRTYFLVITDVGLDHTGVYTDEFQREADGWKISRRQVRLDHVSPQSLQFPGTNER